MSGPISLFEKVTRVAPLGVRFWDSVTNALIGEGLTVTAYPSTAPYSVPRVQAIANRSGVYVLHDVPGLHDFEHGTGGKDFWDKIALEPKRSFVIEVNDAERRFLPFQFPAELPLQGLFTLSCLPVGSPPWPEIKAVPLFSATNRAVPAGMAVLRADLRVDRRTNPTDPVPDEPAAWALIEAHVPGQSPVHGVADEMGRIILIFPFPVPLDFAPDSPLTTPKPLVEQQWSIQLRAFYSHAPKDSVPRLADLCNLFSQPTATLWADAAHHQRLTAVTLNFGQELIVRSKFVDGTPLAFLLITPAGSPP